MAGEHFGRLEITSRAELRQWLAANHGQADSVWLVTWKKGDTARHVSYNETVEELLCFGWVDSLPRKLDAGRTMRLMSPRRVKSNWSRVNRDRVEKLLALGLMQPSGMRLVELAKTRGTWDKLDAADASALPDDLEAAFSAVADSAANFNAFPKFARSAILEWIMNAKQPATRAKRIEETARLAGQNIRANQWRPQ